MIHVKQGDRQPAAPATINKGGVAVSLEDAASITFKMRLKSQMHLTAEGAATIVDAPNGVVEYRWAEGDTDMAGDFYASWVVTWSDGTQETFPTIHYDLIRIDANLTGTV
ncbi:MAG: hypothetical protein ABFR89_02490 [Actinomycetota bacterium]